MKIPYRYAVLSVSLMLVFCAGCQKQAGDRTMSSATPVANAGPVRIITDRGAYHPSDTIHVIVFNTLAYPIFAWDSEASCSILVLQFMHDGQWVPSTVALCALGRSAMPVRLDAGGQYSAAIRADSGLQPAVFPVGTYRLLLSYGTQATFQPPSITPPFAEALSAPFTVQTPT
jgi:hypothetical protein